MENAEPSLLNSGYGNDVGEGRRQLRGLMDPYVKKIQNICSLKFWLATVKAERPRRAAALRECVG